MINILNVSKHYRDIKALDNINLKIEPGEFVSLIGPSGAGKSTLVKLLVREELPTSGRIFVADKDIDHLRWGELPFYRRKIGVVFQDYKLLPKQTVKENLCFTLEICDAASKEIEERVNRALELVGMSEKGEKFPHQLSGGERQRAAIARAIIHNPDVLIADEPTGNLDPIASEGIVKILLEINERGKLVILATHNQLIVNALERRVVGLNRGRIISDEKRGKYILR